jgi:sugar (pentulose or hexulose) kinase
VENTAHSLFGRSSMSEALQSLGALAASQPAGAHGTFLTVPIWRGVGHEVGAYQFRNLANPPLRDRQQARATMESIGYAVNFSMRNFGLYPRLVSVCGGGSLNTAWPAILADTAQIPIRILRNAGEAVGAAIIAARSDGTAIEREEAILAPTESTSADRQDNQHAVDSYMSTIWAK